MGRSIGIALACALASGCGSSLPEEETAEPDRSPSAAVRDVCRSGSAASCTAEGEREGDPEAAARLFSRACSAGEPMGCARLAEQYERGIGVERDIRRAVSLYEQACRHEVWNACAILGYLFEGGHGVARNLRRSTALYELACAGGERVACSNLGLYYLEANGVDRSVRRAARLFGKACDLGHGTGCVHLAELLETERGDTTSALFFRLRGCLAGHADTCAALRHRPKGQHTGAGASEERAEAACKRGDGKACVALGHMILERKSGRRAEQRAFAVYRKACDMSQAFGCLALARMFEDGRGVSADRRRADSLRGRACSMDPLTCPRRAGAR